MAQVPSTPLAGRTVLVTGGSGGIRATALGLATMGARVAITGRDRERTEGALLARSAQSAAGRWTCSSRTCPPSRRCGGWPTRCSRACRGPMCW